MKKARCWRTFLYRHIQLSIPTEHVLLGENYNGETQYRTLKINICPMAREVMERTFWHEIFHTLYDNLGYGQHDEKVIDELAGALYAVIVDNPDLFGGGGQ
jgi:hypothetical protein